MPNGVHSASNPARRGPASGSRAPGEASAAPAAPGKVPPASGPGLRRSKSLPRLPSHPFRSEEVETVRKPITRPEPDGKPPEDFRSAGGKRERAELKQKAMARVGEEHFLRKWLMPHVVRNPQYREFLQSVHPKFMNYSLDDKMKACIELAYSHPKLRAEVAKKRNESYSVPNYPTSSRMMKASEQKFLSEAMQRIREDIGKKPFHMHGESGVVGDKDGKIREFRHNPEHSVNVSNLPGDKYILHNHRPYSEPYTSSASETDHKVAAATYLEFGNKINEYVTNGKDVMHIPPDSMGLIRLVPDPETEKTLGKFPVAFTLPEPQKPARPFRNHEAPAAFKKDWEPPAGWNPPEGYPRSRTVG